MATTVENLEPREETRELSVPDAVSFAIELLRAEKVSDAEVLLNRILEVAPNYANALHFRGVVALHLGREDEAIAFINKSIAINPGQADWYNNLGNVLRKIGRIDDAVGAYQNAVALCPSHAGAYNNLGTVLNSRGRFEDAARAYERAIECDPDLAEAYNNYGNLLFRQGKVSEAVSHYAKAMKLNPGDMTARRQLATAYVALGQPDKAGEIYRKWLEEKPDDATIRYLYAACLQREVPGRAPDAYIEKTFDNFAVGFDSQLEHLGYQAPQLVADALREAGATPDKRLIALDAGCGTGLCGPLIAPYVARLHGIDLSSRMLERARKRPVYDALTKAELTGFLQGRYEAYDLIVSADTLVYFGALETVLESASGALRREGLLIFTVEAAQEDAAPDGFRINAHGRYSHTAPYVERVLRECGFQPLAVTPAHLRMEAGLPVSGFVVTARNGPPKVWELTIPEAFARAVERHRCGEIDAAGLLCQKILKLDPDHADALHFLGMLTVHRGDEHEGLELINKSIAIDPDRADRYNNLGNALRNVGRVEEALDAYRKAIGLCPSYAGAYSNLGAALNARGRHEEAARAYERAIECDPKLAEAYHNYGNLLARQGKVAEAVIQYARATILRPPEFTSKEQLASACVALGQLEAAAEIYRKWLEEEPENPGVRHVLAAFQGGEVPDRASDAYMETAFDAYAPTFDEQLQDLRYQAPQLVADALCKAGVTPDKRLVALDAGCGTGLCGPLIAPYVSRLHGVDLSSAMLEKARARSVYDELTKAELTSFLQEQHDAFDFVVSADTLVYFGTLESVFGAAYGALRADGLLIFTVEAARETEAPNGYRINPTGRYSHADTYVQRVLRASGFQPLAVESAVLRMNNGVAVDGLVVTARRQGPITRGG